MTHRIFATPVSAVYPHYLQKAERNGRTRAEVDELISWLTGYSSAELSTLLESEITFKEFFSDCKLNENASKITGTVCGVKVQEVADPLMRKIRYLDKIIDELAKGKALEKIKR